MHSFLNAVGFSNVKNRKDLEKIIGIVMDRPTEVFKTRIDEKTVLTEMKKDFSEQMGISILGEYDEKGFFHLIHYFPYLTGTMETWEDNMVINKRIDSDAYTGMCDDVRLGVSLIFYLQNVVPFVEMKEKGVEPEKNIQVYLSALSTEGKIILGTYSYDDEKMIEMKKQEQSERKELLMEARKGNQEAINTLTLVDIDMYAMISKRARKEDVYSIVDTSFVPYGSESDNYSILGTIKDVKYVRNLLTGEMICKMLISCNDILFDLAINANHLKGEPQVGRRFKGNIWMQGWIQFQK